MEKVEESSDSESEDEKVEAAAATAASSEISESDVSGNTSQDSSDNEASSSDNSNKTWNSRPTCRYCYEPSSLARPLFFPCKCSGTMEFIHQDCLMNWILKSNKPTCPNCNYRFQFRKIYSPEMPQSIGIGDILSTVLSPITKIMAPLPPTLVSLIELAFICIFIPFLTLARFRRNLFSMNTSKLMDFPVELIAPIGLFDDFMTGVFYILTIGQAVVFGVVFQYKYANEDRHPEWLDINNPFATIKNLLPLVKEAFGFDEEENLVDLILEPVPQVPKTVNFWKLCFKMKLMYIYFFWPFVRVPIQSLVPMFLSIGFVVIVDYGPFIIGKFILGMVGPPLGLDFGYLNYWISTYFGYVVVTFGIWFLRNYINKAEYVHSVMRVLLVEIFEVFLLPLITAYFFDLCYKSLNGESRPNFLDYSIYGLFLYSYFAYTYIFIMSNLLDNPILSTTLTEQEKIASPYYVLLQRLGNMILVTVSSVFLLFWIPSAIVGKYLPISKQGSQDTFTWTQMLQFYSLNAFVAFKRTFVLDSIKTLIEATAEKLRILIIYGIIFGTLTLSIFIGQEIRDLVGNVMINDSQTLFNGAFVLWLIFCVFKNLKKDLLRVGPEPPSKLAMIKNAVLTILRSMINPILLLGILPMLIGVILVKYFSPFGFINTTEGIWNYWSVGIFFIQLIIAAIFYFRIHAFMILPGLVVILKIGFQVFDIIFIVMNLIPLQLMIIIPYSVSGFTRNVLYAFGFNILNSSIEKVVYPGFLIIGILMGLYSISSGLFQIGIEYVQSKYLVGDNLVNLVEKERESKEEQKVDARVPEKID